jgi:hypothetical protein
VKEVHIFRHDQSGTYRIHELQDASDEEDKACNKTAEAFEAKQKVSHKVILLLNQQLP